VASQRQRFGARLKALERNDCRLVIRTNGPRAWLLADAVTGLDVGGIDYVHDADGDHYRPWLLADGVRSDVGEPLAQLAMAARVVADEVQLCMRDGCAP
jgi:hypothetical protein